MVKMDYKLKRKFTLKTLNICVCSIVSMNSGDATAVNNNYNRFDWFVSQLNYLI